MKSILYKIIPIVVLAAFFSCEETEFPVYDENYVAFSGTAGSVNESFTIVNADGSAVTGNNSFTVEVVRGGGSIDGSLTVGITATAAYTKDSDFASAGDDASGTISFNKDLSAIAFASGQVTSSFTVTTTEDLAAAGDISVSFEITSVSDNSYSIGQQESKIRSTYSLTVIDDDCPIDLANVWAGEYEVLSVCAAPGSFNDGFCENTSKWAGLGNVTLTPDASDPLGLTAILSGGIHADDVTLFFQTCPMTVFIDAAYNLNITQGSQARILPPDEPETYGTGSYNEEALKFNIVVSYSNQGGSNFDEFILEYEKVD